MLRRIANVTDTPAGTDLGSCAIAMKLLGMKRPAMLTPFDDCTHQKLKEYAANDGIEVAQARSVLGDVSGGELRNYEISTMDFGKVRSLGVKLFKQNDGADSLWITGALMPAVSVVEALEQDLGAPVVSSM